MASQAQIDVNRRNAARSTGPKTEAGTARARLDALNDGTHARIAHPVLPQENAAELQRRIDLKVAAASAEKREPGRAARPVGKQRPRDKSPSVEAMEIGMMMRLVEQAVDLKVLPDRALVAAGQASAFIMSELRRENAKIEAKCQEPQVNGRHKDKTHAADFVGKIEANCESRILLATDETRIKHG